ncbi:unnamed protein product [Acanthoscelides obtectus]|uniref:Uncharacterized protein n=1 Tax=Acanthoscelides obtectus TaxID=200917 RepID=A0A9P0KUQ1_ACAOB|nr:unnamed protein product [Acanthoscelides obtectus]CAK1631972.1 hypothetical protein AOBTE_LOCUS7267 [Acanthoscelides obtectus]
MQDTEIVYPVEHRITAKRCSVEYSNRKGKSHFDGSWKIQDVGINKGLSMCLQINDYWTQKTFYTAV